MPTRVNRMISRRVKPRSAPTSTRFTQQHPIHAVKCKTTRFAARMFFRPYGALKNYW